jgi:hypothetical protein
MTTVRELTVRFGFNVDEQKLKRIDVGINKLKRNMEKVADVGKKLTVRLTLPIVALGAGMVKLASDAEETGSKFDAVFKNLAPEVRAFAENTEIALGRSRFELEEFLAGLQDTFVPLGFARDRSAELSKQLTTLAIDVASFQNKSEPDVIRAFTSAIVGNGEAVRSFGIILTQAALDQELLNMGITGGARNATEQQKVMARLNIIMKSTTDAHGDAAKTAGSFANQVKALRARSKDLATDIGRILIPTTLKLVKLLLRWVNVFSQLDQGTKELIVKIAGFAAALGPALFITAKLVPVIIKGVAAFRSLALMVKTTATFVRILGKEFILAELKALLIPIALIAAAVALGLLIDDVVSFLQGHDSIIGRMIERYKEWKAVIITAGIVLAGFAIAALAAFSPLIFTIALFVVAGIAIARVWDDVVTIFNDLADSIERIGKLETFKQLGKDVFGFGGELLGGLAGALGVDPRTISSVLGTPKFQQGTPFVPQTMLATVHRGEAIIPAPVNPFRGRGAGGSTITINQAPITITGVDNPERVRSIIRQENDSLNRSLKRNLGQ